MKKLKIKIFSLYTLIYIYKTLYFLTSVKHLTKYHINFSYLSYTTMVLEITHLVGWVLFFLTVLKLQLLMVFTPAMLKLLLEYHTESVLGPMLFLLYINDLNNAIKSQIKLFC